MFLFIFAFLIEGPRQNFFGEKLCILIILFDFYLYNKQNRVFHAKQPDRLLRLLVTVKQPSKFPMTKVVLLAVICDSCFGIEYYKVNEQYDIDELIRNKAKFDAKTECFLDIGPCNDEFLSYKGTNISLKAALEKNNPKYYGDFLKKYDPDGKYMDKFLKAIADF
ncbi:unnamed protein product [Leptidea sinapis]|uniref:Uncharacterized protein n=1 Tax=Leptidea sinapis TaxID=189913 RepID=A0A5E4QWH2_9NEOP|nr:unnamed protein product [Leptidea sinapis]